jgi:hypothetical protein
VGACGIERERGDGLVEPVIVGVRGEQRFGVRVVDGDDADRGERRVRLVDGPAGVE